MNRISLAIIWLLAPLPAQADFQYANFITAPDLNFVGSAATVGNRLRLTPNAPQQTGGAWRTDKQVVGDGFETSFQFELSGGTSDGFAFLVQNDNVDALYGPGARLGFGGFGNESGGIPNSLAIEFDTFPNAENNDPNGQHVSIQSRGLLPNSTNMLFSLGDATLPVAIRDTGVHSARIRYLPGQLSVYFDDSPAPVLTAPLDLGSLLSLDNGTAFVGFTAGTGDSSQNHDLLSWQFERLSLMPGDANLDGKVTGADYTIWAAYFSLQQTNATWSQGDFNGDGKVTGADYTIWAANFTPVPSNTVATLPYAAPEPTALVLLLVGIVCFVLCR